MLTYWHQTVEVDREGMTQGYNPTVRVEYMDETFNLIVSIPGTYQNAAVMVKDLTGDALRGLAQAFAKAVQLHEKYQE